MTTEDTPLLQNEHDSVYERFSPQKKKVLVAIVSWGGLVACEPYFFTSRRTAAKFRDKNSLVFTSGTFVPSIPQMAKELNSTGDVIRYVVVYLMTSLLLMVL